MHITFDSQIFRMQEQGGISKYFVQLAQALQALGHNVNIAACIHNNQHLLHSGLKYKGLPYHSFKRKLVANRFYNFSAQYNFYTEKKVLSEPSVNIIHQTYNGYELYAGAPEKTVVTVHDLIHEKYQQHINHVKKLLERKKRSIENAAHIICISENTRKDLLDYYHVEAAKISVVHHGVEEFNTQQGRLFNDPYILYVGKRGDYKNFNMTLRCFAEAGFPKPVKLLVFGNDAFNSDENSLISELCLQERVVHLKGSDAYLVNLYQHAFFLVYPSTYEGFGMPVLEAMANGCPVICSNGSSLPEICNGAALQVNCEQPEALREAMFSLFTNTNLHRELIALGKKNVKRFTWQATALKTLEVYKQLTKNGAEALASFS